LINPYTTNASFVDLCASSLIYILLEDIYGPDDSAIQYAAIGTICDVVPVLFDNRYVIQAGLELLGTLEDRPSRFVKAAGVYVQNEKDISFSLGPMLNSPRRLGEPAIAVSAYLFDDENAIGQLKNLNKKRKLLVGELIRENRDNIIVNDGYVILEYDGEAGLAGLIAGKLCGEYNRTAIAISKHDQRGSVRTVNGTAFDIIEKSESVFGGGHENAAGFKLNTLDGFITELSEYNHAGNTEERQVDFTVDPETAIEIYRTLQELRPFGNGFGEPIFSATAIVEHNGRTSGGYPSYLVDGYKAMAFSEKFDKDGIYDIIYKVGISNFYGKEYILLTIL
jgi:single-stranded-DNA-specific exonuclease